MINAFGMAKNRPTGLEDSDDDIEDGGPETLTREFFEAIKNHNTEAVRILLSEHKTELTRVRVQPEPLNVRFPVEVERDAYTLLGAYLGPLTGLQYCILTGRDVIARDIIDTTFDEDIDAKFGSGNTALHLAVLLGASAMVSALIERGADVNLKNKRGYSALDMSDNPDILDLLRYINDENDESNIESTRSGLGHLW